MSAATVCLESHLLPPRELNSFVLLARGTGEISMDLTAIQTRFKLDHYAHLSQHKIEEMRNKRGPRFTLAFISTP